MSTAEITAWVIASVVVGTLYALAWMWVIRLGWGAGSGRRRP